MTQQSKIINQSSTQQYSPDFIALLEENIKLKQQRMTVEMERKFLKKWQHTLPGKVSKLRIYKTAYPVTMMANLFDVSVSRFYDGLKQGVSQRAIQRN